MPVTGIPEVLQMLQGLEGRVTDGLAIGVQRGVLRGQGIVQGKASGRPGPRVITGNFRRSIVGDFARSGSAVIGQIGSNAPQGPRLEFGFTGTDVLGRYYNQPPYPSFMPSVPEVTRALQEEIASGIQGAFG